MKIKIKSSLKVGSFLLQMRMQIDMRLQFLREEEIRYDKEGYMKTYELFQRTNRIFKKS